MLTLGIAIIGLCLIWLAPRPVQEIWTAEELESGLGARVTAAHVKEMPALAVIDLEGDGDDDLVYYNRQMERLLYYRNRGSEGLVLTGPSSTSQSEARLSDRDLSGHRRGLRWADVEICGTLPESMPPEARDGLFFDADNDGDLDIVAVAHGGQADAKLLLFHMRLASAYREIAARLGPAFTARRQINDIACGDFNSDGLLDLALARPGGSPIVLWNHFAPRNYLGLYLALRPPSRAALPEVEEEPKRIVVEVTAKVALKRCLVSTRAESSRYLHFGLGDFEAQVQAEILWPGGGRASFPDLEVNAVYEITEGVGEARLLRR